MSDTPPLANDRMLPKGTEVVVRWYNDCGQHFITTGAVAGYEGRGRRELWVNDDDLIHRRSIPLDNITSLFVASPERDE